MAAGPRGLGPGRERESRVLAHHRTRSVCFFLAVAQLLWVPIGCSDSISGGRGQSGTFAGSIARLNLGEFVFRQTRTGIVNDPDHRPEQLQTLDAAHDEFVAAVNTIVGGDALANLGLSVLDVFTLIDDGTLPGITSDVAGILDLLVADQDALDAIARLSGSRTTIPTADVVALLGQMIAYPQVEEVFTTTADLIADNDGVDENGQPNGEPTLIPDLLRFAASKLRDAHANAGAGGPASSGSVLSDISEELLVEARVAPGVDLGAESWSVRVDGHGNAKVTVDPATGQLWAPFVDGDGDGDADVDASGRPVDAGGAPIEIGAFGSDGLRDGQGRALEPSGSGAFLYDYFDAKRTLIGLLLRAVGDGIDRDIDGAIARLIVPAMGPKIVRDNGTPTDPSDDFETFRDDNDIADLLYGTMELAKADELPKLLEALAALLDNDPDLGERVLVTLGRAMDQLAALPPAAPSAVGATPTIDTLVPLVDQIVEQQASPRLGTVPSTARLLLDVLHQVRRDAQDLPAEMAPLFRFKRVEKESAPDGDRNNIDEARSDPVDPTRAPFFTDASGNTVDNRSSVHRSLDLLARSHQCPIFGKTLAVMILEMMADLNPSTVGILISLVNAVPFISNLLCPGTGPDLQSLDDLAKSGALDVLLPITKAFKDRGQVPLLADILTVLRDAYDRTVPSGEDRTALVMESGAIEEILDLLAIATTVQVPSTGENAADVVADALEAIFDDDGTVLDRHGSRVPTLLHGILLPARQVDARLEAAGVGGSASDLGFDILAVLSARRVDDGGTPNDPSDDTEVLLNRSLVPFLARVLQIVSDNLDPDPAVRRASLADSQRDMADFLADRPFAAIVDLIDTIEHTPAKQRFKAAWRNLLSPQPTFQEDALAALLKVVSAALQVRNVDSDALAQLGRFGGDVVDPDNGYVTRLIHGIEQLLTRDGGRTLIGILRNALQAPAPGVEPPIAVLLRIFDDIREAGRAPGTPPGGMTAAEVEEMARDAVAYIRDDRQGLERIYTFIRNRPRSTR